MGYEKALRSGAVSAVLGVAHRKREHLVDSTDPIIAIACRVARDALNTERIVNTSRHLHEGTRRVGGLKGRRRLHQVAHVSREIIQAELTREDRSAQIAIPT